MAVKIEKDTIIGDVLDIAPHAAPLFFAIGMHCLGCPSSRGETVEEACMVTASSASPSWLSSTTSWRLTKPISNNPVSHPDLPGWLIF